MFVAYLVNTEACKRERKKGIATQISPKDWYFSLENGSYSGPDQCSLAWMLVNIYMSVGSRQKVCEQQQSMSAELLFFHHLTAA
jgi:hypothetical protein